MAIITRGAKARAHYHWMAESLHELEFHLHGRLAESGQIPEEWEEIARLRGPMPKVRVTLWVEGDVVKFFRAAGQGHTTRMADVLRTFMHARMAGILAGAEGVEYGRWAGDERRRRMRALLEYTRLRQEADREGESGDGDMGPAEPFGPVEPAGP
jgi:uncharacterized protein (DUF4415 family)